MESASFQSLQTGKNGEEWGFNSHGVETLCEIAHDELNYSVNVVKTSMRKKMQWIGFRFEAYGMQSVHNQQRLLDRNKKGHSNLLLTCRKQIGVGF